MQTSLQPIQQIDITSFEGILITTSSSVSITISDDDGEIFSSSLIPYKGKLLFIPDDILELRMIRYRASVRRFTFTFKDADTTISRQITAGFGFIPGEAKTLVSFPAQLIPRSALYPLSVYDGQNINYSVVDVDAITAERPASVLHLLNSTIYTDAEASVLLRSAEKAGFTIQPSGLDLYINDIEPSATISFHNRFLCHEQFYSWGKWERKSSSEWSEAFIGRKASAYDPQHSTDIVITSQPLTLPDAERALDIGRHIPDVTVRLWTGAEHLTAEAVILKSEITRSDDPDEDAPVLKLTLRPKDSLRPYSPDTARQFTEQFTKSFS